MKQLLIQIKTHVRSHAVDFQFPGEIPVRELIPLLIQINGWPENDDQGEPIFYWLDKQNTVLDDELTLLDLGIQNGETLFIKSGPEKPKFIRQNRSEKTENSTETQKHLGTHEGTFNQPPEPKNLDVGFEPLILPQNISIQDRRSQIAAPSEWQKIDEDDIYE